MFKPISVLPIRVAPLSLSTLKRMAANVPAAKAASNLRSTVAEYEDSKGWSAT